MTQKTEQASALIADPRLFSDWWQNRGVKPFGVPDTSIIQAAQAAGLVARSAGLLWLTAAGRALRNCCG
jgi:hypothetical protein